jgi:HEAT repeat protein
MGDNMTPIRTFGRQPKLEEVKEYYARDDVLSFISDALPRREVVLSFKEEPSIYSEGKTSPIRLTNVDELREYLIQRFSKALPEKIYPPDKPLRAYPSFHFFTKGGEKELWDFVMEADCPGWRRSFVDVRGAVEILHAYHVPLMIKFSGHRSLHLIIPREAFPEEFRGQPIGENWKDIEGELRGFFSRYALVHRAHGTGGMLRLPYSLNENTGIVSLPIRYDDLNSFRPWEAFHHLVNVEDDFKLSFFIQKCRKESGKMAEFLDVALSRKSISPLSSRIWSFSPAKKPQYAKPECENSISAVNGKSKLECENSVFAQAAWYDLVTNAEITDETVRGYRYEENPDVRWFIAESLMGDERAFNLLPETDEYALCAIEDSIAYLANNISISSFFDGYLRLNDYYSLRGLQAIIERLDLETLRKELFRRIESADQQKLHQLIGCASIIGTTFNEWEFSEEVIRKAQERFPELLDEVEVKVFEAIKGLESRRIHDIRKAQQILMVAGKRAIGQIIIAMTSNKPWVRRRAMDVVLGIKEPAFIECLVNALADEDGRVRNKAMSALIEFGDAAKTQLEEAATRADNPVLRVNAIHALRMIEGKGSVGVAVKALESTNIKVKRAAIRSLGRIDDEHAREALKSALWDVASDIGVKAAFTLAGLGNNGLNILRDALAEAEAQGEAQAARCIAHGLAKLGDHSGLNYLISAIYDELWNERSTPNLVAQLKQPKGNDALLDYAKNYLVEGERQFNSKARNVIGALSKVEDKKVAHLVQEFLANQEDKRILKVGIDVLRIRATELKDQESVQALIDLVQVDNSSLAQRAASALVKVGQEAIPAVEEAFARIERGSKPEKLMRNVLAQLNRG